MPVATKGDISGLKLWCYEAIQICAFYN